MGRIEWLEIEHLPEEMKDGRRLLGWHGVETLIRWADKFADVYGDTSAGWYDMVLDRRVQPTHFAEINAPDQILRGSEQ
ncbi:hypothetical protein [Sphingomonas sp.]|uniref:hypothetical protein n=1 Tax=Sphingomonas sp. TaxID=28214 RepID=UPI0031D52549